MNPTHKKTAGKWQSISPLAMLTLLAAVLTGTYAGVAIISFQFGPGSEPTVRPVLGVLALLGFAFLCYLLAIRVALNTREGTRLLTLIVLTSVLMRVVSLFSWPILEIDIYRYIWDGRVVLEGVSPYRYSPEQVRSAKADEDLPEQLHRLVELSHESKAVRFILHRIHFGELPTIYPPVSQGVFAVTTAVTPIRAGPLIHVLVMKTTLVLFDLATVAVIIGLLRLTGKHLGWSLAYAWCPLVIKEVANTGHLDSIPVFLTVLALYFGVKPLIRTPAGKRPLHAVAAALFLALAVGAKLYPIMLAPWLVLLWSRTAGRRWALGASVVFLGITTAILWPLVPAETRDSAPQAEATELDADGLPPPPLPDEVVVTAPQDPSAGLQAFLRQWEMNDLLFLMVVENLRPSTNVTAGDRPWFSTVPESWKTRLLSELSQGLVVDENEAAFILARVLTGSAFLLITAGVLWHVRSSHDPAAWLRAAFLILAWLWLLSPTQNPWYWTWALSLVMFARCRAWLAVSGLLLAYYFRFWLIYHYPETPLLGTPYAGAALFDYVVVWLEFAPWLILLAYESCRPKKLL